jgi:hypothetical protein
MQQFEQTLQLVALYVIPKGINYLSPSDKAGKVKLPLTYGIIQLNLITMNIIKRRHFQLGNKRFINIKMFPNFFSILNKNFTFKIFNNSYYLYIFRGKKYSGFFFSLA